MNIWTIYRHPVDYPHDYVARRFEYDKPTADVLTAPTLDAIRAKLPEGLYHMARHPNDDPKIVEVWL